MNIRNIFYIYNEIDKRKNRSVELKIDNNINYNNMCNDYITKVNSCLSTGRVNSNLLTKEDFRNTESVIKYLFSMNMHDTVIMIYNSLLRYCDSETDYNTCNLIRESCKKILSLISYLDYKTIKEYYYEYISENTAKYLKDIEDVADTLYIIECDTELLSMVKEFIYLYFTENEKNNAMNVLRNIIAKYIGISCDEDLSDREKSNSTLLSIVNDVYNMIYHYSVSKFKSDPSMNGFDKIELLYDDIIEYYYCNIYYSPIKDANISFSVLGSKKGYLRLLPTDKNYHFIYNYQELIRMKTPFNSAKDLKSLDDIVDGLKLIIQFYKKSIVDVYKNSIVPREIDNIYLPLFKDTLNNLRLNNFNYLMYAIKELREHINPDDFYCHEIYTTIQFAIESMYEKHREYLDHVPDIRNILDIEKSSEATIEISLSEYVKNHLSSLIDATIIFYQNHNDDDDDSMLFLSIPENFNIINCINTITGDIIIPFMCSMNGEDPKIDTIYKNYLIVSCNGIVYIIDNKYKIKDSNIKYIASNNVNMSEAYVVDVVIENTIKYVEELTQVFEEKMNPVNKAKLVKDKLKSAAIKLKDKEVKASKEVDAIADKLEMDLKMAFSNSNREAVIKGKIIPSFSKLLKIAIFSSAAGYLVNPIFGALSFLVSLSLSANATKKEREIVLDEISVELQVISKELSKAESEDDIKRYRELLLYKKRLEAEKRKILYHVKDATRFEAHKSDDD